MRVDISRWTQFAALGVFAASISVTGCSGGWKMPTMKMPWSKKPNAAALAGSGPSSLTYPDSPASKQTPSTIASAASKDPSTGGTASPAAGSLAGFGNKTTPNAYSAPSTAASAVADYKAAASGAASSMNGYATGPYNTYGQANGASALATAGVPAKPPTSPTSPYGAPAPGTATGYAATNPYAPPAALGAGLPSSQAYGGGSMANSYYGGRPSTTPAIATAGPPAAPPTSPYGSKPASPTPQFAAAGTTPPAVPQSFANASSSPTVNPTNLPINGGTYTPVGIPGNTMTAPTGFAQSSTTSIGPNAGFAMPGGPPAFGSTSGQGIPAQTAAYSTPTSSNASAASFRPGSTSRTTGYHFGQQATGPAMGAPQSSPSVPYTANGMSNPGYSIPPHSTLNR